MYEEKSKAEAQFIENEREKLKRLHGIELPFESEMILRYAFAQGWAAIEQVAFKRGFQEARTIVQHSIGLFDQEPGQ